MKRSAIEAKRILMAAALAAAIVCAVSPFAAVAANGALPAIQYQPLVDQATRGVDPRDKAKMSQASRVVVRRVLERVQQAGGVDPHANAVLIEYDTRAPGVVLPDYLQARYPQLISIVLQYQFEHLNAGKESFSVDMFFNKKRETLVVPYSSITRLIDDKANFKLDLR